MICLPFINLLSSLTYLLDLRFTSRYKSKAISPADLSIADMAMPNLMSMLLNLMWPESFSASMSGLGLNAGFNQAIDSSWFGSAHAPRTFAMQYDIQLSR